MTTYADPPTLPWLTDSIRELRRRNEERLMEAERKREEERRDREVAFDTCSCGYSYTRILGHIEMGPANGRLDTLSDMWEDG
jgi:hypothetical protein